jgi:hypothetical protein
VDGMFCVIFVQILFLNSVLAHTCEFVSEVQKSNVDFKSDNEANRVSENYNSSELVKSNYHVKECSCKTRPCIRTCCPLGMARKLNKNGCFEYSRKGFYVNTTNEDGSLAVLQLNNLPYDFVVDRPCEKMSLLDHNEFDDEQWYFYRVSY